MNKSQKTKRKIISANLHLKNNEMARSLLGPQGAYLKYIQHQLSLEIKHRGLELAIKGAPESIALVKDIFGYLSDLVLHGKSVSHSDVERAIYLLSENRSVPLKNMNRPVLVAGTTGQVVAPRTVAQKKYLQQLEKFEMVISVGPAGTGKTYLAMAAALQALMKGEVKCIILTRPAIEAGESLGFLPGDLEEKVNPYLRPLYDALRDMTDFDRAKRMLDRGEIEVAPLAYMRGRTLSNAFIILDEAQNCTREQMRMFLTRIGENSKVVVNGDVTQVDLPKHKESGLAHAIRILQGIKKISVHRFESTDIVRHPLVQHIVDAYEKDSEMND